MKKYAPAILQIAIWTSLWAMLVFTTDDDRKPPNFEALTALRVLTDAAFFNIIFYLVLPIYFSKGQKQLFFALSALAVAGFVAFKFVAEKSLFAAILPEETFSNWHKRKPPTLGIPIFLSIMIYGAAATVRGFLAFENKKRDEEEANRRRLEAELALLKSQINPHFLLNTLNNLYGIALTEPEKTPDALLKLSEMVRYILYECAQPTVPLGRDLDFVKNYVALQHLRLPPNANLKIEMPDDPPENRIEPMILIPFIENAFKHGLTARQPCEISISIKTDPQRLVLKVGNQIFSAEKEGEHGDESGIGLTNTRQRLEQSYPGRHDLKIENDGTAHRVELVLDF